jgi:hypothetical protein
MRVRFGISIIVALCGLSACNQAKSGSDLDQFLKVNRIESDVGSLERRVAQLEHEKNKQPPSNSTLMVGDSGFSVIDTAYGKVTVRLMSVKAEGAGSRVRIKLGNPLNATLTDIGIFTKWGAVNEKGEVIEPPLGEKYIKLEGDLPPGRWTERSFVIDGAKPDKLGYVRMDYLNAEGVSLLVPSG